MWLKKIILLALLLTCVRSFASSSAISIHPIIGIPQSRAILDFSNGSVKSPSNEVACGPNELLANSSQHIPMTTFSYINGITQNWNNLPNGRNVNEAAVKAPPQYGLTCRVLDRNLTWQSGGLR